MEAPITLQPVELAPLQGRRLRLERRGPQHATFIWQCRQDQRFRELYRTSDDATETVEQIRAKLVDENKLLPQQLRWLEWVIIRVDAEKPVGLAAVADYQPLHQRGEFLIGILDPADQKTGIGLEAALLVFDFAFNFLKLHKFMSFVYGYNPGSLENTLQLGFTQEGWFKEHMFMPQRGYIDLYQTRLLASEFRANVRLARLSRRLLGCDVTQVPQPLEVLGQEELTAFENQLRDFFAHGEAVASPSLPTSPDT